MITNRMLPIIIGLVCTLPAQSLTLEDIFPDRKYYQEKVAVVDWLATEGAVALRRMRAADTVIVIHDLATGEEIPLWDRELLGASGIQRVYPMKDVDFSPDRRYVIIPANGRLVWRRSTEANYYLYDREGETIQPLTKAQQPQSNVKFSPDSRKVAYVMDHDLYVLNLDRDKTRRLTTDGSPGIINGQADWLYEEEFSLTRAFEWSPDSKSILFLQFDQRHLRVYPLVDELAHYPQITAVRYPKVGERNSYLRLGLVAVRKGKPRWFDLGPEQDIYVPRIFWTGRPQEAAFYRLDRRQQNLELVLLDLRMGSTRTAARQSDPAWVDVPGKPKFLPGGGGFIWTSEESGFRHIYRHSLDGGQPQPLTSGEWEVTEIIEVDRDRGEVYFTGKKDGSEQQQVYVVSIRGNEPRRLSPTGGWNTIDLATDHQNYILWRSTAGTPPQVSLFAAASGERERWLVEDSIPALKGSAPAWELFTLTTADGTALNAALLKPPDFDPTRRYPTLIYTYGGPGSQAARDRWAGERGLWHYYLSQQGYIILIADNRGTGGRGKAFTRLAYGDMGRWPLHDLQEAARWISRQSWGDPDHIGIWGWSFGGYATALALSAGADLFKMGMAVSPVTDFRLYDTAWTERYMGLLADNAAGYASTNVLEQVAGYRGGLLLIHGTGDDNVHAQNSWQLIEALVDRNQPFDLMFYPNQSHSLPDVRYHLYQRMTRFLEANL